MLLVLMASIAAVPRARIWLVLSAAIWLLSMPAMAPVDSASTWRVVRAAMSALSKLPSCALVMPRT